MEEGTDSHRHRNAILIHAICPSPEKDTGCFCFPDLPFKDYNCRLNLIAALKSGHIRSLSLDLKGFKMGGEQERGRMELGGNLGCIVQTCQLKIFKNSLSLLPC